MRTSWKIGNRTEKRQIYSVKNLNLLGRQRKSCTRKVVYFSLDFSLYSYVYQAPLSHWTMHRLKPKRRKKSSKGMGINVNIYPRVTSNAQKQVKQNNGVTHQASVRRSPEICPPYHREQHFLYSLAQSLTAFTSRQTGTPIKPILLTKYRLGNFMSDTSNEIVP